MAALNDWQVVDANNNAAPPDGWPENTMQYSDVNNTGRAVQGTMKRFFADINGSLDAAGAADVYTLTLNETGYTSYFDGMMFSCTIPVTNLTTTPTMDVNSIGAANIVDRNGNAVGIGELMGGGVYDFRHDGTNLRIIGGQGVAGLDTQFQFNSGGAQAGSPGLTYNTGNDQATAVNPFNLANDLIIAEQTDLTSSVSGGFGYLWVRDDDPCVLVFRNDNGTDTVLGTMGSTVPGGADTQLQYNNGGSFGGITELTYNDGNGTLALVNNTITNTALLTLEADELTTGYVLDIDIGDGGNLGGGGGLRVLGPSSTTSSGFASGLIASVSNANHAAIAAFCNGTGASAFALTAYSNINSRTEPLVFFENDAGSSGVPCLRLQQDDSSEPALDLTGAPHIKFNGGTRSTDVNTLDDYEEGTFVVTATADTGTITLNGGFDEMSYTKIGRIVHCQGLLEVGSVSSPTGELRINGLPFVSAILGADSAGSMATAVWCQDMVAEANGLKPLFLFENRSYFTIEDETGVNNMAGEMQAGTNIQISFSYLTTL